MSDVTQILQNIEAGDPHAAAELLPLVYEELRRLARARMAGERVDHTLQATALVHEAYLRLVGPDQARSWSGRGHFFSAAAEAIRRILVERARSRNRMKRGGDMDRIDLDWTEIQAPHPQVDVLALNEALELFAECEPEKAELVKLRYYTGLTIEQAAEVLGISTATAGRSWRYARAWLAEKLSESQSPGA